MPLWDAVALGLAGSGTNPELNGVPLINNSYNCYVGSVLAFYIGEGRVTAIYGGETKLVFDWESVLFKLLDGAEIPFTSITLPASTGLRKVMGGGDTTLVLGPTNKLNYYGADLAINRAREKFELVYMKGESASIPFPDVIKIILGIGFLGILATSLVLKFWWDFYGISSTKPQTDQEQLASVLIPMFEGLWLSLLYAVETTEGGLLGAACIVGNFFKSMVYGEKKVAADEQATSAATAQEEVNPVIQVNALATIENGVEEDEEQVEGAENNTRDSLESIEEIYEDDFEDE